MKKRTSCCLLSFLLFTACSFNYDTVTQTYDGPNLIMNNAEYVRITNGNPEIHLKAEEIRQFEAKHTMELDKFSFEQYNAAPEGQKAIPDINTRGKAGFAQMETDTGNFSMKNDISIEVSSEDISLETAEMTWKNEDRTLAAPGQVSIQRSDGTTLTGADFSANARDRSWKFGSAVAGSIVEKDDAQEDTTSESFIQ
jgi:LPS export ABC transporter protein LptC